MDSSCIINVRLSNKALLSFAPKISDRPIDLRPDELSWTAKYPHGVFAFYQQGNKEYFGISFQNRDRVLPYVWEVPRKYHAADSCSSTSQDITCRYPMMPGTFQPIAAPLQQIEVFRRLLEIAFLAEENDLPRLNKRYDSFIRDYGFVGNYRSYFEGVWWIDLRLSALLLNLEKTTKTEGSQRRVVKGDIFTDKCTIKVTADERGDATLGANPLGLGLRPDKRYAERYPLGLVQEGDPKIDRDEPVENQLKRAFDWCISWYGEIDLEAIAIAVELPVEVVSDRLREMKLIFREIVDR